MSIARSVLRSSSFRNAAARVTAESKAKATRSPFHLSNQKPISQRILFRSPVEMSSCVESLMPFHTATSTALLTSMLFVTRRSYGWLPEACNEDL